MTGREKPRILCVSRSAYELREMRSSFDTNHISAVVLDSEFSTEAGWSAAQTLKMVNPRLPVMLLLKSAEDAVPSGVDAVAHSHSHILPKLKELLAPRE
jgi:DNA-binding response OmpR family regulator